MASIPEACALQQAGQLHAAAQICVQLLAADPNQVDALHLLGVIAHQVGKYDVAVAQYQRALQLRPDLAKAHCDLGITLKTQGRVVEAIASYERALQLRPDVAVIHSNLGNAFKDLGRHEEAIASFRRALQLNPNLPLVHSNLLYSLIFCPDLSAEVIFDEHRRWYAQCGAPLTRFIQPHSNDPSPDRRLRIGYVSPDFRNQAETFFTIPLFAAHDHRDFEIYCYSDVVVPDELTRRLQSCADVWRNIVGQSDEQVTQLIRQDRIDVLVDLTMHMARNRLLVFARKPAPVQVCWLAYQGTTGLATIDYRVTDAYCDPPGLFDRFYAERSIRLPDAFGCYDPLCSEPAVNALPALESGYVTFGSFNNFCKINASILKVWAQVLKAVEHSRMLILAAEGAHRQDVLRVFEQQGVAPERVAFVAGRPRGAYLELYHQIDIGLDTVPYNGQTTSLDAFWMGVPVLSLVGRTAVGRAGLSLLTNLGLRDWIAETPEQFVAIARTQAADRQALSQLRAGLRARLQASPLMDAARFARNMEAAYRQLWHAWCARSNPIAPPPETPVQ